MRKKLVDELRRKNLFDEKILKAMDRVPRHLFIPKGFEKWAYEDVPFPIGSDQTISQPYTVAFQTMLLDVQAGDKILEIGTGSGYQADKILVTCGAPTIPPALVEQLSEHGLMVIPVGSGEDQVMNKIYKRPTGPLEVETHGMFRFVPFLGGLNTQ